MANRTSKVILSKNIKLDKNYKSVLGYTETQMLSMLTNSSNLVYQASDYQFIRETGVIKVSVSYGTCVQANYIAFQNYNYSNKWFFAFIDKIEMKGENCTYIYYTVDSFSTWFEYWTASPCYIVRQHATTDVAGDNTVPEGQELGEYVGNGNPILYGDFADCYFLVVTSVPYENDQGPNITNLGGIWTNGYVYVSQSILGIYTIIDTVLQDPKGQVLQAYIIPKNLIPTTSLTEVITGAGWRVNSFTSPTRIQYSFANKPTTLNGYTPVNQKLLTYPYMYCILSNMNGSTNILQYEKSTNTNNAIKVSFWGVPTAGGSIYCAIENYDGQVQNMIQGLVGGKYPTLGWSEDAFTNWLTQNAVNNTIAVATAGLQIIGGVALMATGAGAGVGVGLLTSGAVNAINAGTSFYEHSREPDSFKGNINAGDIMCAIGAITFEYIPMSIRYEYAQKLDKFLTRYGYRMNQTLTPNFGHRQNYNYIQIASEECIGYPNNHNNLGIPAGEMELINNIFRSGVTIWNNHTNFGDYSVSNNITN